MQTPRRSSLTGDVGKRTIREQQRERDLGQRDLNCRYKAMAALKAFANLGFRKASMAFLAECIGNSRQTLYNRFEGKELILVWAVSTLSESLRSAATVILAKGRHGHTQPIDGCAMCLAGSLRGLATQRHPGLTVFWAFAATAKTSWT